jgi:hypothetical protein
MKLQQNIFKKIGSAGKASAFKRKHVLVLLAIFIYCLLGLAAYWPIFPGDSSRLPACVCGDSVQSVWFLRWVPFALTHGHNPFFTTWLNFPAGTNLAQNTLMPLLGLLTAPLTLIAGPIASFNFLAWLAFPLSAGAMFYLIWRLSGHILPAFIAGLLYGFSPYVIGQAYNHIMLSFIPLPPLIILTVWQLFVEQKHRPRRLGLVLAIEVVAQFLIEPEVLALTALVILLAFIVALATHKSFITRDRLIYAVRGLAVTTALAVICLAYPIWFMLSGPRHFSGPNFLPNNPYRSDLAGLVAPSLNQRFVPSALHEFAGKTAGGDYQESGDYVGLGLLVIICISVVRWRRNRWLVLSSILALICWILSLGPRLVVGGAPTSIPMPFTALVHLPLLENILPSRLSLAEWLLIPIVVALIIIEWRRDMAVNVKSAGRRRQWTTKIGVVLVAAVVFIPLIPRWPYPSQHTNVPDTFAASNRTIPEGSVVLSYPYPLFPSDQAMLWQANNGMRFKLLGSYIQNLSPQGTESQFPQLLSPPSVQSWLAHKQGSTGAPWPVSKSVADRDVKSFLLNNTVGAIIVDPNAVSADEVASVFRNVLGPPKSLRGVLVWTHVQSRL